MILPQLSSCGEESVEGKNKTILVAVDDDDKDKLQGFDWIGLDCTQSKQVSIPHSEEGKGKRM